ncbi:hypothetical protein RJT34_25154 [Clitoria ternatea]|uniref:Transcription factor n=1 Tax=Clitoria ternatea TaxID=43366 RepID=A0AAN9FP80_CLITE
MFSSTFDSNLFPSFPSSSSYPTLPFLIDPENDFASTTLLDDPLVVPFIPSSHNDPSPFPEETVANLAVADCTLMLEQDANTNYGSHHYGSNAMNPNFLTQKPAIAKKDRHSKIHTSQGLRDRRVRLSSEIARKFFDLQDMLEFDKPSNTLEWLFTKSENAIKELARSKHSCSSTSGGGGDKCSCDYPSVDSSHNNNKSLVGDGSKGRNNNNRLKWAQRDDGSCVLTKKESRERARARARERTCYKMCSTGNWVHQQQDFDEIIRCPAAATSSNTQMLHQLIQPEPEASCARWVQSYNPYLIDSEGPRDHGFNAIDESIMNIKRNMKPSSLMSMSSSNNQQNLVIPRDNASFNINNECPLFPYSTPNWDTNYNGAVNGRSNFCGIGSMSLSTCFMNQ